MADVEYRRAYQKAWRASRTDYQITMDRKRQNAYCKARWQERLEKGLCPQCGGRRAEDGWKLCPGCREKKRARNQKYREKKKEVRDHV